MCPTLTDELMRLPAKGAVSRRGYAGNTQTGVMVWMGKMLCGKVRLGQDHKGICWDGKAHSVDQRIRYMPALMRIAATVHTQNMASIVASSHGPAFGTPYWQMFMRMVPMLRQSQY